MIAVVLSIAAAFQSVTSPAKELPRAVESRMEPASLEALRRDPRRLPRAESASAASSDAAPPGMRGALLAIRERDLPRALARLYAVLDARPDYPPALYEAGVVYFRLQRYGDAAAVLERFLEVAPDRVGDTRALGHCYYSLGDYARAKAHYERVLAASPRVAEAWRGLALSEMHLGDLPHAIVTEIEVTVDCAEEPASHQLFNGIHHIRLFETCRMPDDGRVEISADDRGHVGDARRTIAKMGEAPCCQRTYLIGKPERLLETRGGALAHR